MTAKVARADRLLNKLTTVGLTPHGVDFLRAALDPMHDTQLKELKGWPDLETAASVNMVVKQSLPIALPNPTPITGNWDLHVVHFPWLNSLAMIGASRQNNLFFPGNAVTAANTIGLGGLCAWIVPAGQPLSISTPPTYQLNLPDSFSAGGLRVIGSGVEVYNTTAPNFAQGSVFGWRQENGDISAETQYIANYGNSGGGAIANVPFSGIAVPSPPQTASAAMLIPGTRQWAAKDGVYLVVPHVSENNPQVLANYTQPLLFIGANADTTVSFPPSPVTLPGPTNTTAMLMPAFGTGTVAGTYFAQSTRLFPMHAAGAIFTGLSTSTTLTLTWNLYLERFPTVAEPEILVLATPSASMDYLALKAYSEALLSLPVAVPAGENGLGDWFAGVVQKVTNWLTPAAKAAGMSTIYGLSKMAGKAADAYMAPPAPLAPPPLAVPPVPPPLPPRNRGQYKPLPQPSSTQMAKRISVLESELAAARARKRKKPAKQRAK